MASNNDRKSKGDDSLLLKALHGKLISSDFFARHWLQVFIVVSMILVYITNRYQCLTRMEEIRQLNQQLQVIETEFIRERSRYMSRIRESSMQQLVDSMRLKLEVQEQPPFKLLSK